MRTRMISVVKRPRPGRWGLWAAGWLLFGAFGLAAQTGEVSGIVVDQTTGAPLGGAQVTIALRDQVGPGAGTRPGATAVLTGAEGKYKFENLAPGDYVVQARLSGYFSGPGVLLTIEEGERLEAQPLRLTPPSVVSGVVLDEEGKPAPGVQVQLLARRVSRGEVFYAGWGGTATDGQGRFRIAAPQSGPVVLSARPFVPLESTRSPGQMHITTYYPNTMDPAAAEMIEIKPGAPVAGLELKLRSSKVFAIRGRVLDADGKPLANTSVSVRPKSGDFGAVAPGVRQAGTEGFEVLQVPPGEYAIVAHHFDSQQQRAAMRTVTIRDADVEGLELRMARGVRVTGFVDVPLPPMAAGGPTDIVPVEGMDHRQSLRLFLTPAANDGAGRSYTIETREDGSFTLNDVQPGRYEVSGFQYGTYLASVRLGEEERLGRDIEVAEGMPALHIEYRADGGLLNIRVEGAAQRGERPPVLVLMPVDPELRRQPFLLMFSVSGRSAELRSLRPGEYFVWMLPSSGRFDLLQEPGFVERLTKAAARVMIEPDGFHEVTLRLTEWPPQT